MDDAVIVSGARTPIGAFGGALAEVPLYKLASVAIGRAIDRAGVEEEEVDEVIMGNILSAGEGMNPARQATIDAGLPTGVPSLMVNKVCGSGLKSVALAAQSIRLGEGSLIVAGGMESMSRAPYLLPRARWGYRMGHAQLYDTMIGDALWCAMSDCHMGVTAENVAARYEITREEMDQFAAHSQAKAARAWETGAFQEEVVPVSVPQSKGDPVVVERDEYLRPNVTPESLAKLRPAFQREGTVTPGNSSGINDGASATVVMSEREAQRRGATPLGIVRGVASAGVEPHVMGIGPIPAVRKVLEKTGLSLEDVDLIELNEAFAAQSLAVGKELGWDWDRVNVNGGAIALGHPVGCSGNRILVTLLHEMRRRHAKYGLATLCIGGGMGIAMVVENPAA